MSELQMFNCEQNTEEWDAARAGIATASEFHTVKAQGRGGGESVTRRKYMLRLVGERIGGVSPFERYTNGNMQRGHEYEPEARELYQIVTGHAVERVGFLRRGDLGCSPDSLIGKDGMLEIKTKIYELHLECLLKDEVPAEHIPQLQGNLLVSARQWIDFASYSPGLPLFTKRVFRDEKYIAMLKVEIDRFLAEMYQLMEQVKRLSA